MVLGMGLCAASMLARLPLPVGVYATVVIGAGLVLLLEAHFPHAPDWRPTRHEVATDLLFLALVQLLLPIALGFSASIALGHALGAPSGLWPHSWPVAAQVLLMLLAADFLRYWLHVAAHHFEPLWRLHAVHHSPASLYSLNVGRFHPLDKSLQYLLDALPFVALGVGAEVRAFHFVFYALNGFFQHSNVELRFGLLNYVVSTAALHRWHHSRLPHQSNTNYGNNLIVWDLVFGTRFLPAGREVGAVGLRNRRYPERFLEQLRAPFIKGIDAAEAPVATWRDIVLNLLLRVHMAVVRVTAWRALVRAAKRPAAVQQAVLRAIVAANRATRFGRERGFAAITGLTAYRARVPVQTYESLRPYVEEHERTGTPQLTAEPPLLYAQTSGTTGRPKYIPVLRSALARQRASQRLFSYVQYRAMPEAYAGRILALVGPAVEGRLESGRAFGAMSGHLYTTMPRLARAKYVLPPEVFDVDDYDLKYRLILRLALGEKNITAIGTANPSTLLKLQRTLREHRTDLLADVEQESFGRASELPAHVRRAVGRRLACSPGRRRELRAILAGDHPKLADLWPHLKLLTTWTGGSCGIALDSVRGLLPRGVRIVELGYLASELRGTITIDLETSQGVPTLGENFFEFVERGRWERGEHEFLTLDRLELGREYHVLVTTPSGLYRYLMNDVLRVTGRFHATPTLQFVQKGKGVTNVTGEKLYESQVLAAVTTAAAELGLVAPFFVMLADPRREGYRLLIEPGTSPGADAPMATPPAASAARRLAAAVEHQLAASNIEYAHKRASGRLHPLEVCILREGAAEAYKAFCVAAGQREGQFKTLALQYGDDFRFAYEDHVTERAGGGR